MMTGSPQPSPVSSERLVLQEVQRIAPPDDAPRPAVLSQRQQSRALAVVQNLLCGYRTFVSLRADGIAVQAALTGPLDLPAHGAWLELEIHGHPAHIGLSWGTIRRLTGLPLESADPVDAVLLVEEALSTWLDAIEEQTGLTIRFRKLARPDPVGEFLRLGLRSEVLVQPSRRAVHLHLPLALSEGAANSLAPVLSRWKATRPENLPLYLRLGVEIETLSLSIAELRSLGPGDALALPDLPRAARLVLEDQFAAPARPASDAPLPIAWKMTGPFWPRQPGQPFQTGVTEPMTEQDQHPSQETHQASESGSPDSTRRHEPDQPDNLDALEIRLSFRLGERLMSLAELRRAGAGTIVTLDRPDGAMVDIVANGQLIGKGEVISVAGQRAVEIHSLFSNE